jgi:hypothetical protein
MYTSKFATSSRLLIKGMGATKPKAVLNADFESLYESLGVCPGIVFAKWSSSASRCQMMDYKRVTGQSSVQSCLDL